MYPLIAFILTLITVFLLVKLPWLHIARDMPNERSLHLKVTPRTGGLGLVFGVLVSWILMDADFKLILLCLFLASLCLVDDVRGLPVYIRFSAQLLIAALFVIFNLHSNVFFNIALIVITMVWMINLYNFMDGSDGLAGGMAIFGFSSYAVAAYIGHDIQLCLLSACVASSSLAFLIFNFSPAKIFMGDAGSITLGFLVAAIGLLGVERHLWGWWFPILVFSPFVSDATVTILKRLLRGEKVWEAHKSHYYQRLIQMGWSHRKLAILEYALMILVGITSLLLLNGSCFFQWLVVICWVLIYLSIMINVDKKWHNFQKHKTM